MKDVYKLMNEIDVDLEQYEIPELTSFEKKRMKRRMNKKLTKRKKKSRFSIMAIAVATSIVLFSFGMGTQSITLAKIPIIGLLLEDFLGTSEEISLEDYKTIVGRAVESEQGSITLNEVIIDEGRLLVNSTFQANQESLKEENLNPFPTIYIDGENIPANGTGDIQKLKDSTYSLFSSSDIPDIDLQKTIEIKIVYADIIGNSTVEGEWVFEFTAAGDSLFADTKTIPINREILLDNGQRISIEDLVLSPVSSTLNYHMYSEVEYDFEYDFRFMAEDGSGKEYEATGEHTLGENSYFRFPTLKEDVVKLKFTPYLTSGREGKEKTDIHHVLKEEEFEVNLK